MGESFHENGLGENSAKSLRKKELGDFHGGRRG
jgi:hypothetical protein